MTDREALLRAVVANPGDDTPRLVYADCVQESGKPEDVARARFIRLQIEMARQEPGRGWFARSAQISEAAALAGQFANRWLDELPNWAAKELRSDGLGADTFRRGFVETIPGNSAKFVAHGETLFDRAPVVGAELLAARPALLTELFASPLLLRLRLLSVRAGDYGNALVAEVARSAVTCNLTELYLAAVFDREFPAREIAHAAHLARLRVLGLNFPLLSAADLEALTTSPNLPALQRLRLQRPYFWDITADEVRRRFGGKVAVY